RFRMMALGLARGGASSSGPLWRADKNADDDEARPHVFLIRTVWLPRSQIDNLYRSITVAYGAPVVGGWRLAPVTACRGQRQIRGSVTSSCAWYLPFLSRYEVRHGSSLWKKSTCAMPSFA